MKKAGKKLHISIRKFAVTSIVFLSLILSLQNYNLDVRVYSQEAQVTDTGADSGPGYEGSVVDYKDDKGGQYKYLDYRKALEGKTVFPGQLQDIVIEGGAFNEENSQDVSLEALEGGEGKKMALTKQDSLVSYDFQVQQEGFYQIQIEYLPVKGSDSQILRSLSIDGSIPFQEFNEIEFSRIWVDKYRPGDQKDIFGNDVRPPQEEKFEITSIHLKDPSGFNLDPLCVYLEKGQHTISLISISEPMGISRIVFHEEEKIKSYEEYSKEIASLPGNRKPESKTIQAEVPRAKSDKALYPGFDRSSPYVIPYDFSLQKINVIGGTRWQRYGQWIEWEVDIKEPSFYKIGLRWRQSEKMNAASIRELYIDGALPFKEAQDLNFKYGSAWQLTSLAGKDGQDFVFYLDEGRHTIRLQVGLGEYAEIVGKAQDILLDLNEIYRQIVMVTGPSPDQFRDYEFKKIIPGTIEKMKDTNILLDNILDDISQLSQDKGANTAPINRLIYLAKEMTTDVETIAYRLDDFQNAISGFGAWVNELKYLPLELDYLLLMEEEEKLPKADGNFFELSLHYIRQFIASFLVDYSEIGTMEASSESSIIVWVGAGIGTTAGRDQSQLIRQLLTESFTPEKGIPVKLQLVTQGSLLPATLAGIGPDVALQQAQNDPMNFALRNAVYDLSNFSDKDQVVERFYPDALEPFSLDDHLYALPETQSFPMLFYRKDILEEMEISVDMLDTWESLFLVVLPKLQRSYLQFGIVPNINSYAMFLYQMGGQIYTDDLMQSDIGSPEGIKAFEMLTQIFTEYKQSLTFDFSNRFRTGQMPIAISDFTVYNQLSVFAPELKGMWEMMPVPGIRKDDGTIDRSVVTGVSGTVIMSGSKEKDKAWEFLKWWTRADIQTTYGRELESIMGDAARYPTANIEAMDNVPWTRTTKENLAIQREFARAIPEVPGGYFTFRNIDFALKDVLLSDKDVRETINKAQTQISNEIVNKRIEFGLEVKEEYKVK